MLPGSTTIHVPPGSPLAAAWRDASAAALPAEAPPAGHLPLVATLPPPRRQVPLTAAQAAERAARAQAKTPGEAAIRSNRHQVLRTMRGWAEKDRQAQAAGVDLRKRTFINKLISTGAALITLGAAIAVTVATFGATLPFAAVAGARALTLIGDSLCAWLDWRGSTETPPSKLPLGANCLGNLLYGLGIFLGADEDEAKTAAKVGSGLITLGLTSASLATGLPQEGISLLSSLLRYVASLGSIAGTASQAKASDRYDHLAQARDLKKTDVLELLMESAMTAGTDAQAYQAWCAGLRAELATHDIDPQALVTLEKIMTSAWQSAQEGEPVPDPVDADRSTLIQRLVNDVVGLQAGATFSLTAAAQGGAFSTLGDLL